jgi:hypothetical protein
MRKKQPYPIDTCQFVEHYSRRLANEGTDTVELRLEDLNNPELLLHLGRVAALSLAKFATCTFLADPDGCVRLMNPLQVFMQADQSIAPEGKVPVFVCAPCWFRPDPNSWAYERTEPFGRLSTETLKTQ